MKTVLIITAIINLLLVVLACICLVSGALNKDLQLFAASVALVGVSIISTSMILVMCTNFKEADK